MKKLIFLILLSLPIMAQVFDRNGFGNDSHCEFLIHGDTGISDASKNGISIANSGVTSSSTQSVFGGASMYFNDDYFTIADSDILTQNGYFSIEARVYFTSLSGTQIIISQYNSGGSTDYNQWFRFRDTVGFTVTAGRSGSGGILSINEGGATSLSINTWYHIRVCVNGRDVTVYKDGIEWLSGTATADFTDLNDSLFVGNPYTGTAPFFGYIDELRISKGVQRWTKNFTPPNRAY